MANGLSFPTVLVTVTETCTRRELVRRLEQQGYLVLQAVDSVEALEIVRVHSRPIQLMLTGESADGRALAATVRRYRPGIRFVFLMPFAAESGADSVVSDVEKVTELLQPPRAMAMEHN